ncbi:MAG TPA: hypothetical protein VFF06_31670 [Polyangia bacterium]|nr:hypothetical protein [Polyangia bacterium]
MSAIFFAACDPAPDDASQAAHVQPAEPLRPVGVYAVVDISHVRGQYPTIADLKSLYKQLLDNPGVSGLSLGVHWDQVQPNSASDWKIDTVNAAFDVAFNNYNPPKTIMLSLSPGIHTPQWVFDQYVSQCDGYFDSALPTPAANCGSVTFEQYPEQGDNAPPAVYPVPWNNNYQTQYTNFLTQLASYYSVLGPHPEYTPLLVAVHISGPIGASPEMILPKGDMGQPDGGPTTGVSPDVIWSTLMQHQRPQLAGTEQPFINAWNSAINVHNQIFTGITLVLTPDNGERLPNFAASSSTISQQVCVAPTTNLDSCEAVSSVLGHFFANVGGANAAATYLGGMTASSPITSSEGNVGLPGIKYFTSTAVSQYPTFAGAAFDHSVTDGTQAVDPTDLAFEGCPKFPAPCDTAESAMYNVMSAFFYGTPTAQYFPLTGQPAQPPTLAPLAFLSVEYQDVLYANLKQNNTCATVQGGLGSVSAQYLISAANYYLSQPNMGHAAVLPPPPAVSGCVYVEGL